VLTFGADACLLILQAHPAIARRTIAVLEDRRR